MANTTDPEKIAQEELFPKYVNGWKFPGRWDNERLHQRLLREAETIAAKRASEQETKAEPEEEEEKAEVKKPAPRRRNQTAKKEDNVG